MGMYFLARSAILCAEAEIMELYKMKKGGKTYGTYQSPAQRGNTVSDVYDR